MIEDAERLIGAWNERQAIGSPMIFSPTIGAVLDQQHCYAGSTVIPTRR